MGGGEGEWQGREYDAEDGRERRGPGWAGTTFLPALGLNKMSPDAAPVVWSETAPYHCTLSGFTPL